jgi:hypothetical protein
MIEEFRQEEVEHKEAALAAGAEQAPVYPLMSAAIRLGLPRGNRPFKTDLTLVNAWPDFICHSDYRA